MRKSCSRYPPPRLLIAALVGSALASPAYAAVCPAAYGTTCAVSGTDVCGTSSTSFTCDVSGASGDSTVIVVEDYDGTYDYEAWGDVNGTVFCCHSDDQYDPPSVYILGSAGNDTLQFTAVLNNYNLQDPDGVAISGYIYGGGGLDSIEGSDSIMYIAETLYGEAGIDTIHGNGGVDVIYGGDGNDVLFGEGDQDTICGGAGNDVMLGGLVTDYMYGESGGDRMSGGGGDDWMDGGTGGDILCGDGEDAGGDYLYDGDATDEGVAHDRLYAANALDENECDDSSTQTDSSATPTGPCTQNLNSPPNCP